MKKKIKVGDKVLVRIEKDGKVFGLKTEILHCGSQDKLYTLYFVAYENGWEWFGQKAWYSQKAWCITEEDIIEIMPN